jgi:formylmethanofuran dehydrogenase subunit B
MICSFCSLLCDGHASCEKRNQSIERLQCIPLSQRESKLVHAEANLTTAAQKLRLAKRVLLTGRIACVETARAAVLFASKFNATIDFAEAGDLFANVQAIQRIGFFGASLAEIRSHADLIVIVGSDSVLKDFPRLPQVLRCDTHAGRTVLLMGQFEPGAVGAFRDCGFNAWSIRCSQKEIPTALSQWSGRTGDSHLGGAQHSSCTQPLVEKMWSAKYVSVLWSTGGLDFDHRDLWVERLLEWIAQQNETRRCAGLPLSSLDGTFQQVCTWLTGFPGRVRFISGTPTYDPYANDYRRWVRQCMEFGAEGSMVLLVDETASASPFLLNDELVALEPAIDTIHISPASITFPIRLPGYELDSEMFRADQTVLARIRPGDMPNSPVPSAAQWLKRLMR